VKSIAKQALENTLGDRIIVRLNADDYDALSTEDYSFKECVDRTKRLVMRKDESVEKGGCIVESEVGTINAQIGPQLAAIKRALGIDTIKETKDKK